MWILSSKYLFKIVIMYLKMILCLKKSQPKKRNFENDQFSNESVKKDFLIALF